MTELRKKPLFQQIADIVRKDIAAQHQPGDRLASDLEMARRFSVSNVTIREAMLSLCQEGLLERKHGSGTYVTRTHAIAPAVVQQHVAIWTETDIAEPRTSPFYSRIIQGLRVFLEEKHIPYKLYLGRRKPWDALGSSNCPQLWKDIDANRINGVLALAASPPWLASRLPKEVPVVGWNDWYPHRIMIDYNRMMHTAVEYLLNNGRKNIVLLRWDESTLPPRSDDEIGLAFDAVTHEFGARVHPAWVRSDQVPTRYSAGWNEFHRIWADAEARPDGLVITDDMLFRDVAMAILSLDIDVPGELMVATHSNKDSGIFHPFPTIRMEIDVDLVIKTMAGHLMDLMNGRSKSKKSIEVPLSFIVDEGAIVPSIETRPGSRLPKRRRAVTPASRVR